MNMTQWTLESVRDRLFTKEERDVIRDLRTISKGNPHTLDYLDGWVPQVASGLSACTGSFL